MRFVDGAGRLLRMGGKVVKNAAGFDLPKFFVGSLGRFGVLAEITFKVFPRPASTLTLRLAAGDVEAAARISGRSRQLSVGIRRARLLPGGLEVLRALGRTGAALAGPSQRNPRRAGRARSCPRR